MDQATIIRNARTAKRLTQDHLAGAAGVSKRTVIRVEQGRPVSSESIMALCNALGLVASEIPSPNAQDLRTPDDVLCDMIRSAGETVVWMGAPDSARWMDDNAIPLWKRYGWLIGLCIPAMLMMLVHTAGMQFGLSREGYGTDMTTTFVMGTLCVLMVGLQIRFFGTMRSRHAEAKHMDDTFHVLSDKALYVATRLRHEWNLIRDEKERGPVLGSTRRIALPDDRSAVRERSLYLIWPRAKVLVVEDTAGVPVVLSGLSNTSSLVGTIRNGLPEAA